jgi:hypothetical protein
MGRAFVHSDALAIAALHRALTDMNNDHNMAMIAV